MDLNGYVRAAHKEPLGVPIQTLHFSWEMRT